MNIARWLRLLRPRGGLLALAFLLGALALLAGLGLLALSGWFITAAAIAGSSAASAMAFDIFRPGALIRACAIVRTASRYGERVVSHDAVLHLLADLRSRAFRRLARQPLQHAGQLGDGELLQRVVSDIDTLDEGPLRVLLPLLWAWLVAAVTLLLIALAAPALVSPALPWLLAANLLLPMLTTRHARRSGRVLAEQAGLRRERAVDQLRGLTTLLLCGAWQQRRDDWQRDDKALVDAQLRQRLIDAAGLAVVMLCVGLAAWTLLWRGEPLLASSPLTVPWLAMAVLATLASLEAIAPTAAAMQAWGRTQAASARLDGMLEPVHEEHVTAQVTVVDNPAGELWLDQVSYHYPTVSSGARSRGLEATTLHVAAGSRVLVSGPSGSGKSTLAALLARVIQPDSGRIELAGRDLVDWSESALRSQLALLDQRPHLFAMSLAENLRLADPAADDERLLAALEAVALGDFIRALPLGLATPIGEYGLGLSGGEARRVALARTLLQQARVVILDEPFEGLDEATRQHVVEGIDDFCGAATVIILSHQQVSFSTPVLRLQVRDGHVQSDAAGSDPPAR